MVVFDGLIKMNFCFFFLRTIVTTCTTAPLATCIYTKEYQRKMEIERGQRRPVVISRKSSDALISSKTNYNKLLVVLNKVEWLPSMMTLVKLLQPLPINNEGREEQEISTNVGSSTI